MLADLVVLRHAAHGAVADGQDGAGFVVLGQMRPNNRTTLINDDLVGTTQPTTRSGRSLHQAFESGTRVIGELNLEAVDEAGAGVVRPVRSAGASSR